jgi:hypothetical protein
MLCLGLISPVASLYKNSKEDKTTSDKSATIVGFLIVASAWIIAIVFQSKQL